MPSSITDIALRAAVNTNSRVLTEAKDLASALSNKINSSNIPARDLATGSAVALGVGLIVAAYTHVSDQLEELERRRLDFDHERIGKIASFIVRNDKEERDFTKEERAIQGFLDLMLSNPRFASYLGIHSKELSNGVYYSVLPFYLMAEGLPEPLSSKDELDTQRALGNLFFNSKVCEAIHEIEAAFQTEPKCYGYMRSRIHGRNYLNNLRAPRFIIIALANLLWNLQHPVDIETGFALSMEESVSICKEVERCMNQLLDTDTKPDLIQIDDKKSNLIHFVEELNIHIKALRTAYAEARMHHLSLDEISNSAHRILRHMDTTIFELIFRYKDPVTKKSSPNKNAAKKLADSIGYMMILLKQDSELLSKVVINEALPDAAQMNMPPKTVMDILIYMCHATKSQKITFYKNIHKVKGTRARQLVSSLEKIDKEYIVPVRGYCEKELQLGVFSQMLVYKSKQIGQLTAQHFVPFITLLIEDYRLERSALDIPIGEMSSSSIKTCQLQVQEINAFAEQGTGYYQWKLSAFFDKETGLDELPKNQYRITQVTKLLDDISDLIKNYRTFLLQKSFQKFLLNCFNKIKKEIKHLDASIKRADAYLDRHDYLRGNIKSILLGMVGDIEQNLNTFSLATQSCENIVHDPQFILKERGKLDARLLAIAGQYQKLFNEECKLTTQFSLEEEEHPSTKEQAVSSSMSVSTVSAPVYISLQRMGRLVALVKDCSNALSLQSRKGHKGMLLRNLLQWIDNHSDVFTEEYLKYALLELTRVVMAYRPNYFFQADYAHTRSSKVLLEAIKDKSLNALLPLADSLLDTHEDISQMTDTYIREKIKYMRQSKDWEERATDISNVCLSMA